MLSRWNSYVSLYHVRTWRHSFDTLKFSFSEPLVSRIDTSSIRANLLANWIFPGIPRLRTLAACYAHVHGVGRLSRGGNMGIALLNRYISVSCESMVVHDQRQPRRTFDFFSRKSKILYPLRQDSGLAIYLATPEATREPYEITDFQCHSPLR